MATDQTQLQLEKELLDSQRFAVQKELGAAYSAHKTLVAKHSATNSIIARQVSGPVVHFRLSSPSPLVAGLGALGGGNGIRQDA